MINLNKGQDYNLSKGAPNLTQARVGLGWDTQGQAEPSQDTDSLTGSELGGADSFDLDLEWHDPTAVPGNAEFDLDVSLFMLGADGKLPADEFFLFYNNLRSPDGAVVHQGDNQTGAGEGDDESIIVSLPKVDPAVQCIVIVATIHGAQDRGQSFAGVCNAYIRLVDNMTGSEVLRYSLNQTFSDETAVVFGELRRENSAWQFKAVGHGSSEDLQAFVNRYA